MNLEDLLILVRCKRFSEAAVHIKSAVLQKREALLVIYEIANAVMHKQILSDDEKVDFISLLKQYKNRTSHLVHDFIEKEVVKYYNCMHFILKYVASNCLLELLDLRELILLHPEQLKNNEPAMIYYTATYNLIYKHAIEPSKLTHTQIIELILLQLEMRLAKRQDFALNLAVSFANLCNAHVHPQMQLDCLNKTLLMCSTDVNSNSNEFYSAVLNALQYVCVSAKREAYKIDLGVVIVLLNRKSVAKCKINETIVNILAILNLEGVKFLPELKIALKTIGDGKFISDIYFFVIAVMQTWIFSETTKNHISECITDFMDIVKTMQKYFITTMKVCQCCFNRIDLNSTFQLFNAVVELLKHSGNIGCLIELFEPMYYISTELIVQLKAANCQLFDKSWSKCSALLNSLGTTMLTNSNAHGIKFVLLLMKQIAKCGFSSNFPKGSLYFIYNLVAFFKQQKDYKSATLFSAIAIYIDTINTDKILPLYSRVLYSFNSSVSEEKRLYGIVHVLHTNIVVAREYIPTIDKNRVEELFQLELNFYLNKWQSKTYMMNLIKQMVKLGHNLLITSTIREYHALFVNLDVDMIAVLQNLLRNEQKSNLNSALLNYLIANNITHNLIQKNQIDMKNTIVPTKVVLCHTEPAPDPNDTCDIVSSYSSLSFKNHKTIVTYLKCALLDIEQSYAEIDIVELERTFDLCSKLAHSFRLHCNFTYSESAWLLAKTIASKLEDNIKLLESIGWLLHKADSNETTLRLLQLGSTIAKQLPIGGQNSLSLCWYHLHICNFHLRNCQWNLAKDEYKLTRELMKLIAVDDDETGFSIHFAFLQSMMSRMPCEIALNKNPDKPELLPKNALKLLISFINKIGYTKIEAFHLTTYFEELDDVLMRLSLMRLPREIRLYGKDVVTLSQKLVLSIRTARILTHLARADVLTCKINDCQMKLDGIADILNLPLLKSKNSQCTVKYDYRESIENKLVDQMREMQLNVPQGSSSMSGSPIFKTRIYNLPHFISHVKNCDCFECLTPEYAILILGKLHIDFLLSESEPDPSISQVIYEMALKVYNFLITSEKTFFSIDYKVYNETYSYFLLDYIFKFGMIKNNLNLAKDINKQVLDLLKHNNRYDSDLLICEANIQRSLILMHENTLNKIESPDNNDCEIQVKQTIDKTPENNYLTKSVEDKLLLSALVIERRTKNIPFHLSDEEEDDKLKPRPENKSPVPKFKIFDDNFKAISAKKSASARKKTGNDLNTAFRCPSASTSKVKERTAKKTKNLTEKLKKSARKQDGESSDSCSEAGGLSKHRTGRKNLSKELKECEQTPKLSARKKSEESEPSGVRRSTRKK